MLLQTVFADDGVGDERIGREDTCQQHRGQGRIAQQMDAGKVGADEGDEKREQSEDDELQPLLLQVAEVHLQSGQEHDVEQAHLAEEFERGVTLQDVQSVFAHSHTRQHHTDDVGDAQFAADDGRQKNDAEHHKEDGCGVCDGKIC